MKPYHLPDHMSEKNIITAVAAAPNGDIFDLDGYGAAGMAGNHFYVLTKQDTIEMPHGSELMMLPDRKPVVFNIDKNKFEILSKNPFDPKEPVFPVAVFNSPGFVNRFCCAYDDEDAQDVLPLFSYGAVGFSKDTFQSAAICVDTEPRQDLRFMPQEKIVAGVRNMRIKYPDNRLIRHIENCALTYGCPAGKNFFLKRYEAPLPTARVCNANCLGCISLQPHDVLSACQDRISFTPSPEEISELALEHITTVPNSVVSFGQGCEGDPLTAVHVIEPAIRQIRKKTDQGTINMNTNASLPVELERLFKAGLDAIRVSMNSVRKTGYNAYFRPGAYLFSDVLESITIAKKYEKFVSINYLNCPGFTDCEDEFTALMCFIETYQIDMIQWRNLNYDPKKYYQHMADTIPGNRPLGMEHIINEIRRAFPRLIHGYFNPPRASHGK